MHQLAEYNFFFNFNYNGNNQSLFYLVGLILVMYKANFSDVLAFWEKDGEGI
jgi:hypothetical protein